MFFIYILSVPTYKHILFTYSVLKKNMMYKSNVYMIFECTIRPISNLTTFSVLYFTLLVPYLKTRLR